MLSKIHHRCLLYEIFYCHEALFLFKMFCLIKLIHEKKEVIQTKYIKVHKFSFCDRYLQVSSLATTRPVAGVVLVNTTTTAVVAATGLLSTTAAITP